MVVIGFYDLVILELIVCWERDWLDKSLDGGFGERVVWRVCCLGIVGVDGDMKVWLEVLDRSIDFVCEWNRIEVIVEGCVKWVRYRVCVRAFWVNVRMRNVLEREIELIVMILCVWGVLCWCMC